MAIVDDWPTLDYLNLDRPCYNSIRGMYYPEPTFVVAVE